MQNLNAAEHAGNHQEQSIPVSKKSYVAPELVTYGSVKELTQGATGSKGDGSVGKRTGK